jgi:RNA polymerase sigma-70 factor, ECF subfamily
LGCCVLRIEGISVDNDQDSNDVRRVLEGDVIAFENIVRRWQDALVNLAFRFCRDPQRAEEMAQDAFVQIYRQLHKFRGEAAFSTWLFAVSLNLFRSSLRRKRISLESLDTLAELAGGQIPHLQIEQHEREDLIRRAVAALPARYRDAVIVYYFKEMDLNETAAILGVPEGTVKAWLHRGRELLRRKFDRNENFPPMAKEVRV